MKRVIIHETAQLRFGLDIQERGQQVSLYDSELQSGFGAAFWIEDVKLGVRIFVEPHEMFAIEWKCEDQYLRDLWAQVAEARGIGAKGRAMIAVPPKEKQ